MRRHELTERKWAILRPLSDAYCQRQGGSSEDNRFFINAVLWRIRTGVPWRDLPERLGKWNSIARRFSRWADNRVWQRLFTALQEPDWEWGAPRFDERESASAGGWPKNDPAGCRSGPQ
ncbi:MAG: transposase [Hymenobacteraceae bacterium]|nr:transposase [Hymenobacteraceae bacterium]